MASRPAHTRRAAFGGWHERTANATMLVPARLGIGLAFQVGHNTTLSIVASPYAAGATHHGSPRLPSVQARQLKITRGCAAPGCFVLSRQVRLTLRPALAAPALAGIAHASRRTPPLRNERGSANPKAPAHPQCLTPSIPKGSALGVSLLARLEINWRQAARSFQVFFSTVLNLCRFVTACRPHKAAPAGVSRGAL